MATLDEYLRPYLDDLAQDVGDTPVLGLRPYLGAAESEDPKLKGWASAALTWCHEKISKRDFVDDEGASADPPDNCVFAVWEYVSVLREYDRGRREMLSTKTKTGAREEERPVDRRGGILKMATDAAAMWLEPVLTDLTLRAGGD